MSIDHDFTDNIVCPHCGYKENREIDFGTRDYVPKMECGKCGKFFAAQHERGSAYSTWKYEDEKN